MAQDSIQRTGASMGRSPANCTVLMAIREEEPVIRLYYLDQWLANVEILDGRLRIEGRGETDWVEALEDLRRFISPENGPLVSDIELYHALPDKLRGHVWADYVD